MLKIGDKVRWLGDKDPMVRHYSKVRELDTSATYEVAKVACPEDGDRAVVQLREIVYPYFAGRFEKVESANGCKVITRKRQVTRTVVEEVETAHAVVLLPSDGPVYGYGLSVYLRPQFGLAVDYGAAGPGAKPYDPPLKGGGMFGVTPSDLRAFAEGLLALAAEAERQGETPTSTGT